MTARLPGPSVSQVDHKDVLQQYLPEKRGSLLSRLDGLDEGQLRQPMTRTGTNLLGLVKHVASVQLGYCGDVSGRPSGIPLPWMEEDTEQHRWWGASA